MEESILTSIKKLLGLPETYTVFDPDVIMHINTQFMVLNQLGVGPSECFSIVDKSAEWGDFTEDKKTLESVKTYIYLRVKAVFDPSMTTSVNESMKRVGDELEWRLHIEDDDTWPDEGGSDE